MTPMELLYGDKYYDKEGWELGKYSGELKSSLREIDTEVDTVDTDVGLGASEPSVLVEIFKSINWATLLTVAIPGVFLLGKKINENIAAWVEIARKVKHLLKKHPPARIDEKAALLVALDRLDVLAGGNKEIDISIQVIPFSPRPCGKGTLDQRPDALYVISASIPDKAYVVGIKSNLKIVFMNEFDTGWLKF